MSRKTPHWLLERLHAGDLPPEDAARLRARLGADEVAELERLKHSDDEILRAYPPERWVPKIQRRAGRIPREARLGLFALAAVLLALVLVRGIRRPEVTPVPDETLGIKGRPSLVIYRQGAQNRLERLHDHSPARAKDLLQVSYRAEREKYGAVFSVDGRGTVTLHFPASEQSPLTLKPEGLVSLRSSYELDDAPAFERFYFVTSQTPFSLPEVMETVRRAALGGQLDALALPTTLHVSVVTLDKVRP